VAFGPKPVLHAALERKSRNRLSRRLQEELARANPDEAAFVWVMSARAIPGEYREPLEDYHKKIDTIAIALRLDEEIALNTTVFCKDAAAAEAIAKEAGEKVNAVTNGPSWFKDFLPKDLLKSTSTTTGNRYTARVTTDADKVLKAKQAVARIFTKNDGKTKEEEKPKNGEKDKPKEMEKPKDAEKPKEMEKGKEKPKEMEKGKEKPKEMEKGKDAEKGKEKASS
jgi:hypothetical protein